MMMLETPFRSGWMIVHSCPPSHGREHNIEAGECYELLQICLERIQPLGPGVTLCPITNKVRDSIPGLAMKVLSRRDGSIACMDRLC